MSQTKYKLPDDLKKQCLSLVQGYKRRVYIYHQRRNAIIYASPAPPDGQPKGSMTGDNTARKTEKLEKIEDYFDTRAMRAVEQSLNTVGVDLVDESHRKRLMDAVWDSCIEGRNFIFEYRNLPIGKTNFYERRREFLYKIAKLMDFL